MERPRVGITMGDPASIGPEIVVKTLARPEIVDVCNPIVIGDLGMLQYYANLLDLHLTMAPVRSPTLSQKRRNLIEVVDLKNVNLETCEIGRVSEEAGKASLDYITKAVEYALNDELDAITTAPINKESIHRAGCPHIGHTELLQELTVTENLMTMFWVRGVNIFFLSRHVPLKRVFEYVQKQKIIDAIFRIDEFLRMMGIKNPSIAVAALNPHASDGGLIGDEESREIVPAIQFAQQKGINAVGPVSADAVFYQAFQGNFDAVLSLYHDQGHIPAKTVDFHGTVSVTLGLPFIRTSVDHGTAFDIAGKGIANSKSLEEAVKLAAKLAPNFKKING